MGITTIDFEATNRNGASTERRRRPALKLRESPATDVVQWFLDYYWIRHPISKATLDQYQRGLLAVTQWLIRSRGKSLLDATEQDLREYFGACRGTEGRPGDPPSLACVKRFYFYLVEVGIRADDPTEHLYVRTPRLIRHDLEVIPARHN